MYKQIIEKKKSDFEKVLEHFTVELSGIRTGRASAALVENLMVESYGTKTPIKNVASITIPEPRCVTIQPWDKNLLKDIVKAVQESSIGIQPVNDGLRVRLNMPPLSEERRTELVKVVKQQAESARVRIRNIREEIWKEITNLFKEKKLTEDQKYEAQEELGKKIEEYNEQIKKISEKKEEEVMTV